MRVLLDGLAGAGRRRRLHDIVILVDDRLGLGAVFGHGKLGPLALNTYYVVWDARVFPQRFSQLLP